MAGRQATTATAELKTPLDFFARALSQRTSAFVFLLVPRVLVCRARHLARLDRWTELEEQCYLRVDDDDAV